jgi:hypothetical protein
MANMQVSQSAAAQEVQKTEAPQKSEIAVKSHLKSIRDVMFGKTGSAILAGAAAGALLGGAPGAVAGAAVGAGAALTVKAIDAVAKDNKHMGKQLLAGGAVGALTAVALGGPVGAAAALGGVLFATGAAQKAASAIGDFFAKIAGGDKEAAPQPAAE